MPTTLAVTHPCRTEPQNVTVDQAHAAMQEHLRCSTDACPQRRTALAVLVANGRYVVAGRS